MELFASLGTAASASSANAQIPNAVQLHTSHRIDFLTGTVDGRAGVAASTNTAAKRRFETLTYQAVEVTDAANDGGGTAGEGTAEQMRAHQGQQQQQQRKKKHQRPNLGIWDCRVTAGSKELVDRLLQQVIAPKSKTAAKEASSEAAAAMEEDALPPTVILAVDLTNPASVYPSMDVMIKALLRRYGDEATAPPTKTLDAVAATTRLSKLRSTSFGLAPETSSEVAADSKGPEGRISLIVCCAVPSTPMSEGAGGANSTAKPLTFQEKQAISLVQYHLHRFASEVNCTLAFIREDDDVASRSTSAGEGATEDPAASGGTGSSSNNSASIPSTTISEFAATISRIASGQAPMEEHTGPEGEGDGSTSEGQDTQEEVDSEAAAASPPMEQPAVYGPGSHDEDLIGSVLLRSASCPGVWDAAKDDLWKALPSPKNAAAGDGDGNRKSKKVPKVSGAAADEVWLSKLAASLPTQGASVGGDDASVKSSKSTKSTKNVAASTGGNAAKAATKKKKKSTKPSASASKNDDPTSFFENLMKK